MSKNNSQISRSKILRFQASFKDQPKRILQLHLQLVRLLFVVFLGIASHLFLLDVSCISCKSKEDDEPATNYYLTLRFDSEPSRAGVGCGSSSSCLGGIIYRLNELMNELIRIKDIFFHLLFSLGRPIRILQDRSIYLLTTDRATDGVNNSKCCGTSPREIDLQLQVSLT